MRNRLNVKRIDKTVVERGPDGVLVMLSDGTVRIARNEHEALALIKAYAKRLTRGKVDAVISTIEWRDGLTPPTE